MIRKFLAALRARRMDRDLIDEVELHIEERTHELIGQGVDPRQAAARARRELGSTLRTIEEGRRAWTFQWIEELIRDLRYAARSFRRSPGFVAAAVTSLALGIGVNTSIYSLTMEFLLSKPSVANPDTLWSVRLGGGSHSEKAAVDFLRDTKLFDAVTGYREASHANWRNGSETTRIFPLVVDGHFFTVARPPLLMGRGIALNATREAVVTYRFWQSRLGGDPGILNRSLQINGEPFTVVGVLPPDHRTLVGYGFAPDIYLPFTSTRDALAIHVRSSDPRSVIAEKVKAAGLRLDQALPRGDSRDSWAANIGVRPVAGLERAGLDLKSVAFFFVLLLVVVGLVLAIACANVSGLLLARASSRRQEMAVRSAIGAGRTRLIRQLLAESLLLTAIGTVAGLAINFAFTRYAERIPIPLPVPVALRFDSDWRLFAYSAAIAVVCALLAGLAPALRSTGAAQLKADSRQTSDSGGRGSIGTWLVPAQIAISVVLLTTGFLFLRNLGLATAMDVGFDAKRVAWGRMDLVDEKHSKDAAVSLAREAIERARAIPGVESAAVAHIVPFNDSTNHGRTAQADGTGEKKQMRYQWNAVTPGYFQTMGIPLLDGRDFDWTAHKGAPRVAIVNREFAMKLFGTVLVAGRRVVFPTSIPPEDTGFLIAGVCGNTKHMTAGEDTKAAIFVPIAQSQSTLRAINVLARTQDPAAILRPLRDRLLDLDPSAAVEPRPLETSMTLATLPSKVGAALLGSIGILGLILAAVGLYGVLAFTVSRRTREIGVRLALGAAPSQISRMVLASTARLAGAGLAIGLILSALVTEPLAMFLAPNLSPRDPLTFASVTLVMASVALLAAAGPVIRAMRVDPIRAIRYE